MKNESQRWTLPESQREQGRQSKKLFQYDFHNSEDLATVSNL